MPTLSTAATESSTYVITLTFTDAAGGAVTPSAVLWSLLDMAGAVINSRSDVAATPGATVTVVLSGNDLSLPTRARTSRVLRVEATYTSTEGAGLPLVSEVAFTVVPTVQ